MAQTIYGTYFYQLTIVLDQLVRQINAYNAPYASSDQKLFEHLTSRIKSDESMRAKCRRKGLPETAESALYGIKDAIGIRIVCSFVEDVYTNIAYIKQLKNVTIIKEKDYIRHAKANGYRSYHMIIEVETPFSDVMGNVPGHYYAEIQLRTIAMDTWAALEHQLKYKKTITNTRLIEKELKRCADELASCDLSLQTIRHLINEEDPS